MAAEAPTVEGLFAGAKVVQFEYAGGEVDTSDLNESIGAQCVRE